jgi:hypothetical protein
VDPGDDLLAAVPADDRGATVEHHHEVVVFLALIVEDLALARLAGARRRRRPLDASPCPDQTWVSLEERTLVKQCTSSALPS